MSDGEAVGLRYSDEEVIGVVSTGAVDLKLVLEVVGGVLWHTIGVEVVGLDNLTLASSQINKVLFVLLEELQLHVDSVVSSSMFILELTHTLSFPIVSQGTTDHVLALTVKPGESSLELLWSRACCWDLGEGADGEEETESNNHDDPTVVTAGSPH